MKKSRSIDVIVAAICQPGPTTAQETVIGHIARQGDGGTACVTIEGDGGTKI